MSKKFIPNGDSDFVMMAESFARTIAKDPESFGVSFDDSQLLTTTVQAFRAAYQAAKFGGRTSVKTLQKEEARRAAELIIRRLANLVRANDQIAASTKIALSLRERSKSAKPTTCPAEPPRLRFLRALHEGGAMPVHELAFGSSANWSQSKPAGAVRLELFVDLIPASEPIPAQPGANHGGRPWYLRSFTRSPIKLIPPMSREPMRVVYWGRWADSVGNVGPFSATAIAWIECGSTHLFQMSGPGQRGKYAPLLEDTGIPKRETRYIEAVLEAQCESTRGARVVASLPSAECEQRRLQGPAEDQITEAA
ncbi:hypothetical protein BH09PLA1_BH09PLA1_31700 [soil metagenome]